MSVRSSPELKNKVRSDLYTFLVGCTLVGGSILAYTFHEHADIKNDTAEIIAVSDARQREFNNNSGGALVDYDTRHNRITVDLEVEGYLAKCTIPYDYDAGSHAVVFNEPVCTPYPHMEAPSTGLR